MAKRGNYKFLGKYSWYTPGIGGMFALLAWLLLGGLIGGLVVGLLGTFLGQDFVLKYGNLISYPMMFVPPMLWAAAKSSSAAMSKGGFKLDNIHFSPVGGVMCTIIASVGTIAMSFWADALSALLPEMPDFLKDALDSLVKGPLWASLLTVSVLAPLCEEWLCRGMILRGLLARKMNPALAISISALFFAIIHLNPWQAIPALAAGALFGYVYYKTGSLKLTMLMHCVNNTFAVVCSNIPAWEDMNSFKDILAPEAYAILIAASVIVTVLTVLAFKKIPFSHEGNNLDPVPSIFESYEV